MLRVYYKTELDQATGKGWISAIFTGVADLKRCFEAARMRRTNGQATLLFVDEIHRFNRAQQDSFLPVMEDGTIILVGATTENPSFELNAALLSRARVLSFKSHDNTSLEALLSRAEAVETKSLPVDDEGRAVLIRMADGDGRYVLNLAEELFLLPETNLLDPAMLAETVDVFTVAEKDMGAS